MSAPRCSTPLHCAKLHIARDRCPVHSVPATAEQWDAAVRRAAITEAVDRMTDGRACDLAWEVHCCWQEGFATPALEAKAVRELLRRALTGEGV